jgi:2-oxoisovalerate dehydrogenase E1 component
MNEIIREAILIRSVEEKLLNLFAEGKLNGTVHTCIGQELSAVCIINNLDSNDFVFSNHRCHGHYISKTKDVKGLIAEIMGKSSGVSKGIGGSQHLHNKSFYSNGIQGSILPISAGLALSFKKQNKGNIGCVFIGDGTFGEGTLYESLNIISLLEIPLVIVCEDNEIAQSTPKNLNLKGSIIKRVEAFDIKSFSCSTDNYLDLNKIAKEAINYVRTKSKPVFIHVKTNRLRAHSKGDDTRTESEIKKLITKDPINIFKLENRKQYDKIKSEFNVLIGKYLDQIYQDSELSYKEYFESSIDKVSKDWEKLDIQKGERFSTLYNKKLIEIFQKNDNSIMIGEDILSPYGGAFKITDKLSEMFPDRVISTPISENSIVGLGIGLSMNNFRPFVEIMFGDFTTLIVDQIVNSAVKFRKMFNYRVECPVIVRTPMGGYRGYGPTHSQTLDKLFIGIDGLKCIALNIIINPSLILERILLEKDPVLLIENKVDYTRFFNDINLPSHELYKIKTTGYPISYLKSKLSSDLVIVCYGGMVKLCTEIVNTLFYENEIIADIIIPSQINSDSYSEIYDIVEESNKIVIIEENSIKSGFGSNLIAELKINQLDFDSLFIGSDPVPIPSNKRLEQEILPNTKKIIKKINNFLL